MQSSGTGETTESNDERRLREQQPQPVSKLSARATQKNAKRTVGRGVTVVAAPAAADRRPEDKRRKRSEARIAAQRYRTSVALWQWRHRRKGAAPPRIGIMPDQTVSAADNTVAAADATVSAADMSVSAADMSVSVAVGSKRWTPVDDRVEPHDADQDRLLNTVSLAYGEEDGGTRRTATGSDSTGRYNRDEILAGQLMNKITILLKYR